MSNFLVAIFFGAGVGGWAYAQLARRSGNANPSSTLFAAAGAGLIAAVFIYTFFRFVLNIS
jgi:hypothetical protein